MGQLQDLSKINNRGLNTLIANYSRGNETACEAAARELIERFNGKVPRFQADISILKKTASIPANIPNPGRDIVVAFLRSQAKLDELLRDVAGYEVGAEGKCRDAAIEIVRRAEEGISPEIDAVIGGILQLSPQALNPGRQIIHEFNLRRLESNKLVAFIVEPNSDLSENAASEFLRRKLEKPDCPALVAASRQILDVHGSSPTPGTLFISQRLSNFA